LVIKTSYIFYFLSLMKIVLKHFFKISFILLLFTSWFMGSIGKVWAKKGFYPDVCNLTNLQPRYTQDFFDTFDNWVHRGNGCCHPRNENCSNCLEKVGSQFAWSYSYNLKSYILMFDTTGETEYLDKLIDQFDNINRARNDNHPYGPFEDKFREAILPGWNGGREDTTFEEYIYHVHTGLIVTPVADFVRRIYEYPEIGKLVWKEYDWATKEWRPNSLNQTYKEKADFYLRELEQIMTVFEGEFVDGPDENEGYYTADERLYKWGRDGFQKGVLPFNQMLELGRVELRLWQLTGKPEYKDHVSRMAQLLKDVSNSRYDSENNLYIWTYWPMMYTERAGYIFIDLEFVADCYEAGIVFNSEDMQRYVNAFKKNIYISDGSSCWAHSRIDGSTNSDDEWKTITYSSTMLRYFPIDAEVEDMVFCYQDLIYNNAFDKHSGEWFREYYGIKAEGAAKTIYHNYLQAGCAFRLPDFSEQFSIPGDLNDDEVVDIFDLVIVGNCFGLEATGDCERADANNSGGTIDIFDLVMVGSHFGNSV